MGIAWIEWEGRWVVDRRLGEKTVGRVDGECVGKYLDRGVGSEARCFGLNLSSGMSWPWAN